MIHAPLGSFGRVNPTDQVSIGPDEAIDLLRARARRPVPAGRIEPGAALGFGVALSVASVVILGLATNAFAAATLAFGSLRCRRP